MQYTKAWLIFFLIIQLYVVSINSAHPQSVGRKDILAALTLNIARFTTWPEAVVNESNLYLCVMGDNITQNSFAAIDGKIINDKTVVIINLSRRRNLDVCQLLFVSELARNKLAALIAELSGRSILTVGENIPFVLAGGMVGLEKVDGKMKLNVNLAAVKKSKLEISSRLLKLANIID